MSDDFSNYPISIAEKKAETEGGSKVWSCRDALISVLRDIDKGELNPNQIAIIIYTDNDDETTDFTYVQKCDNTLSLLGMYAKAMGRFT